MTATLTPTDAEVAARVQAVASFNTAKAYSGPDRVFELLNKAGSYPLPYLLALYVSDSGGIHSAAYVVLSNKRANPGDGTIMGVSAVAGGAEPSMLAISPDVDGPAAALEAFTNEGPGNANRSAIGFYDLNDTLGGATGWSAGYGKKKAIDSGKGNRYWGANLGLTPYVLADISMERAATGELVVKTAPVAGQPRVERIKVHTTGVKITGDLTVTGTINAQGPPGPPGGGSGLVPVNAQTGTAYTLVDADAGKLITCDNDSPVTVTVPGLSVPVGTRIEVAQFGTGRVTLVKGTGTTTLRCSGVAESTRHTTMILTKVAAAEWYVTK